MYVKKCIYNIASSRPKSFFLLRSKNFCRSYSILRSESRKFSLSIYPRETAFAILKTFSSKQALFRSHSHASSEECKLKERHDTCINIPPIQFEDISFEQPVTHEDLLAALQKYQSFDEQMESLPTTLLLSSEDVKKRINFAKKIESVLRPFFEDFNIQIFGSTVNGFGFKGCDIDMSFEASASQNTKTFYLETPNVPFVSEVVSGKVSPQEISLLPAREQLLFIHSVLLEYYKESTEPAIFINAHVPLVRFHHEKYNLKCDLSCGNRVAFSNTKLLYLYGKLDKRVIPLMASIRYWAKHVELIGKGLMFNTYTITLLVIHFLQTRDPPILPSAEHIISLSDAIKIEDMDDNSFLDVRKSIPLSRNNQTLGDLLKEFFFDYLFFDFTRVVCPLTATSVPREEFFSGQQSKKFRMHTICVQDPMLTSHNVADLVDYKHCKRLFAELMTACKLFQNNSVFTPTGNSKWGLMALFDKPKKYSLNKVTTQRNVSFTVPLVSRNLQQAKVLENEKFSVSAETVLKILEHALLIECQALTLSEVSNILEKEDQVAAKQKKILVSV